MKLLKKLEKALGVELSVPNAEYSVGPSKTADKIGSASVNEAELAENAGGAGANSELFNALSRVRLLSEKISVGIASMTETAESIILSERGGESTETVLLPRPQRAEESAVLSSNEGEIGFDLARSVAAAANELGRQLNSKVVR